MREPIQIDPRPICPACKLEMSLVASEPKSNRAGLDERTFKYEVCEHVAHLSLDRWSGDVSP